MNYQQEIEELLETTAEQNASDLHLTIGRYPTLRVHGGLVPLIKKNILSPKDTEGLAYALISEEQKKKFLEEKELDFSYNFRDRARFRCNLYFQRGYISAALRLIPAKIKTIEELNLPQILKQFCKEPQGFFLSVGPTGHGKTTTLAAMVDLINHSRNDHILTIEDPIEYLFIPDRAIVSQREVGADTADFSRAMKAMFREDIDVAMIGEMRDAETIAAAVTAAETGHLVVSTLHTNNASQTIDRIIDSFPAGQQGQIRSQLSNSLIGIVSQRLIPKIEGGLVPAVEILIATPAVRNLIRENKTYEIDLVIETSAEMGMVSLNRSLSDLVRRREISLENAETYSLNPQELRMLLRG